MTAAEPPVAAEHQTVEASEKRVGWAELFFDLVFVFAITQISALLLEDHGVLGCVRALVVFVPLYWAWVGTTIQANVNDMTSVGRRLSILAVALAGLVMALAVPDAFGDRGLLFAAAYWAARMLLGIVLFSGRSFTINPVTTSMLFTGPMLVVGGLFDGSARLSIWAVAGLVDLSSPTVLRRRLRGMHFDPAHLAERFGLFVLIALGESVVAIGLPAAHAEHLDLAVLSAVVLAFVVVCGLWWLYFAYANDAMRHALATAQVQLDVARHVLSYGHVVFIAAVICIAVGLEEVVAEPEHHLSGPVVGLLFGGCAVFCAAFVYTRWSMFRIVSTTRLGAAGVIVVLSLRAPYVPALAALGGLGLVFVALNTIEYRRVQRGTS